MRTVTVFPNARSLALRLAIAFLLAAGAYAQEQDVIPRAIELEKKGNTAAALALLEKHLAAGPQDNEARIRYGIILSWEKHLDQARKQLEIVLASSPNNGDALTALINVELWSDHPARAEELAKQALLTHPNDPDFLLTLARAQKKQLRTADAKSSLNRLLEVDPERRDAQSMKDDLEDESRLWEGTISSAQEYFSDGRSHWSEWQSAVTRHTNAGSFIGRFSRADRFGSTGYMAEIETYLRVRKGTQVYLNGGFSADFTLYPRTRFGAEIFQSLPGGFEFSTGYRRLNFTSSVNIYTGSVTKYYGNWMFVGRGYFTPGTAGTSITVRTGARRYFKTADDYIGVWFSRGASPTEIRNVSDLAVLHATSYSLEYSKILQRRLTLRLRAGYSNEQRLYFSNLQHYLFDVSLYYRF